MLSLEANDCFMPRWIAELADTHVSNHSEKEKTKCTVNAAHVAGNAGSRSVDTHTHTTVLLLFWNLFRTTQVSRYQEGYNQSGFTGARDSEWQWHLLGYMQRCKCH